MQRVNRSDRARCTSVGECPQEMRDVNRGNSDCRCRWKAVASKLLSARRVAVTKGALAAASSCTLASRACLPELPAVCTHPTACRTTGLKGRNVKPTFCLKCNTL